MLIEKIKAGIAAFQNVVLATALLAPHEIDQITWSARTQGLTPERAIHVEESQFIEVRRCLSRLYCLNLLTDSTSQYDAFIAPQDRKNPYIPPLEVAQFERLKKRFEGFDQLKIDALRASTIISSVPLSPKAREAADKVLGKDNYTMDSVEFLADTFDNIEHAKAIYPILKPLYEKYPNADDQARLTGYLKAAFAHRMHYRHMLYTEGNGNMYRTLLENVAKGQLSQEHFDFWRCHWTINITGFRGHEAPKGSIYLQHNTFKAMEALEALLQKAFENPQPSCEALLEQYLDQRAEWLKLSDTSLSMTNKRLLAHLGSMLRLFHPDEGEALLAGFKRIPPEAINALSSMYFDASDPKEPTPTYAPALFQNVKDWRIRTYSHDSILRAIQSQAEANIVTQKAEEMKALMAITDVVLYAPLYLEQLKTYRQKRAEGSIPANQPLSFQQLAGKKEVMTLFAESPILSAFNILTAVTCDVDPKGNISATHIDPSKVPVLIFTTSCAVQTSPVPTPSPPRSPSPSHA